MSEIDDGGPAFPRAADTFHDHRDGMSLRDWFAGQIMNGFASDMSDAAVARRPGEASELFRSRYWADCARTAYEVADAMLAERAKAKP